MGRLGILELLVLGFVLIIVFMLIAVGVCVGLVLYFRRRREEGSQ